ncbi:MAG: allantoinase AllB [Lachnospiraceae bacterium]|nr:allantoinase AllB [Lachnospiraceae bacterium]
MDLLIENGTVFLDNTFVNCNLGITDGKISYIGREPSVKAARVIDAKGKYVLPGSIDTHVHIRAPGGEYRETFYTGSMAAAAGGTTVIVEQPICNPTPYNKKNLLFRDSYANKECVVDYAFYGAAGCQYPEAIDELKNSGIVAYKTFLTPPVKGREEEFVNLYMDDDEKLFEGMKKVAATGLALMFHAENHKVIHALERELCGQGKTTGIAHVWSRPEFTEVETIRKIISFAEVTGTKLIFAHVSTAKAMEEIRRAKLSGMEIGCETCVHYLTLTEEALETFGPFAKCNPPVRSKENQDGLWEFVNDGYTVDAIGSDHSPFLYEEKKSCEQDIFKAPAGLVGIDLRVPLMLDAALKGKTSLENIIKILSEKPARMLHIEKQKGKIALGLDADILLFDPQQETVIDHHESYSKTAESQVVYQGVRLQGRLESTIIRGREVCKMNQVDQTAEGYGKWIKMDKIII